MVIKRSVTTSTSTFFCSGLKNRKKEFQIDCMMQTGQQVTRLLRITIALWMHVCNKCCTSEKSSPKDIFAIIHLKNLGTSNIWIGWVIPSGKINSDEASFMWLKNFQRIIYLQYLQCSFKSIQLTRTAWEWEDTNLSVNHFSHASPQPFKDPVNHSILLWLAVLFSSRKLCKHNKWTERRLISDSPTKSIVNVNVKALLWTVLQMKVNASC